MCQIFQLTIAMGEFEIYLGIRLHIYYYINIDTYKFT